MEKGLDLKKVCIINIFVTNTINVILINYHGEQKKGNSLYRNVFSLNKAAVIERPGVKVTILPSKACNF